MPNFDTLITGSATGMEYSNGCRQLGCSRHSWGTLLQIKTWVTSRLAWDSPVYTWICLHYRIASMDLLVCQTETPSIFYMLNMVFSYKNATW